MVRQGNSQRMEVKYLITEPQALAIRDYIDPFVQCDPHAPEYTVTSVYLDSPDLRMFWSSDRGEKNRYKLRIRSYGASVGSPVFFEIKQRIDQVNRKQRVAVLSDTVQSILRADFTPQSVMCNPTDFGVENLLRFRDLMELWSATPKVAVRYEREAFAGGQDDRLRITFDRNVSALTCPEYFPGVWSAGNPWRYLDIPEVILELKFSGSFPKWLTQLVSRFNLYRMSMSKYVECLKTLHNGGRGWSSYRA